MHFLAQYGSFDITLSTAKVSPPMPYCGVMNDRVCLHPIIGAGSSPFFLLFFWCFRVSRCMCAIIECNPAPPGQPFTFAVSQQIYPHAIKRSSLRSNSSASGSVSVMLFTHKKRSTEAKKFFYVPEMYGTILSLPTRPWMKGMFRHQPVNLLNARLYYSSS